MTAVRRGSAYYTAGHAPCAPRDRRAPPCGTGADPLQCTDPLSV